MDLKEEHVQAVAGDVAVQAAETILCASIRSTEEWAHLVSASGLILFRKMFVRAADAKAWSSLLALLRILERIPVTFPELQRTQLMLAVIRLSNSPNAEVKKLAHEILSSWKRLAAASAPPPPPAVTPPRRLSLVKAKEEPTEEAVMVSTPPASLPPGVRKSALKSRQAPVDKVSVLPNPSGIALLGNKVESSPKAKSDAEMAAPTLPRPLTSDDVLMSLRDSESHEHTMVEENIDLAQRIMAENKKRQMEENMKAAGVSGPSKGSAADGAPPEKRRRVKKLRVRFAEPADMVRIRFFEKDSVISVEAAKLALKPSDASQPPSPTTITADVGLSAAEADHAEPSSSAVSSAPDFLSRQKKEMNGERILVLRARKERDDIKREQSRILQSMRAQIAWRKPELTKTASASRISRQTACSLAELQRQQTVSRVFYVGLSDVPDSPAEPILKEDAGVGDEVILRRPSSLPPAGSSPSAAAATGAVFSLPPQSPSGVASLSSPAVLGLSPFADIASVASVAALLNSSSSSPSVVLSASGAPSFPPAAASSASSALQGATPAAPDASPIAASLLATLLSNPMLMSMSAGGFDSGLLSLLQAQAAAAPTASPSSFNPPSMFHQPPSSGFAPGMPSASPNISGNPVGAWPYGLMGFSGSCGAAAPPLLPLSASSPLPLMNAGVVGRGAIPMSPPSSSSSYSSSSDSAAATAHSSSSPEHEEHSGRVTCKFFLAGKCARGSHCRFYHPPR